MKPWKELFFEEVEAPHHFHIGMRIVKTVLAVFVCSILGWLRGEPAFFSMIAAVLCMQKSAEKTLTTSFNRVIGTAVGGAYGVIVLFLETQFHLAADIAAVLPYSIADADTGHPHRYGNKEAICRGFCLRSISQYYSLPCRRRPIPTPMRSTACSTRS